MLFTTSFLQGASLCIILDKYRQLTFVSGQLRNRNFIRRICSSRTVQDSIVSEDYAMLFDYFYRCLKTFITVVLIDLYYADAFMSFCHY